ncbi:MAG: hypothetical protein HY319_06725 [Armatimonadetes bacterium]|nr:hypothetical protein [Armatimonadota bacterium]
MVIQRGETSWQALEMAPSFGFREGLASSPGPVGVPGRVEMVAERALPSLVVPNFDVAPVFDPVPMPGPAPMSLEEAVKILQKHFFLVDVAGGIGSRDGIFGKADLWAIVNSPDAPAELRRAAQLLLSNPAFFNTLDVAQEGQNADGLISRTDLETYLREAGGVKKPDKPSDTDVLEDVIALHEALEHHGVHDKVINRILANRSNAQIKAIKAKYEELYGVSLEQSVRAHTGGDYEDLLLEILKARRDESGRVDKDQAYEDAAAIHGAVFTGNFLNPTDEATLNRIFSQRSKEQIEETKKAYRRLYGRDMVADVKDDTSGKYQRLLMALIGG